MNRQFIITLGFVAVLVVSGCTQLRNANIGLCEANYVKSSIISTMTGMQQEDAKESCKTLCYDSWEKTSFKVVVEESQITCYCDVNDCGDEIFSITKEDEKVDERSRIEKCVRASIVIKSMEFENGKLFINLYNMGVDPLKDFEVQVTYSDLGPSTPTTWKIFDTLDAASFETYDHEIEGTHIDFVEVRSVECAGAYDLIRSYDISGLP